MVRDYVLKIFLRCAASLVLGHVLRSRRDIPGKNGGPRIWRRFKVSGALSLSVLADKIMLPLMGWYGVEMNSLYGF